MDLIEVAAEKAKLKLVTRPSKRTDRLLGILRAVADFEERIDHARTEDLRLFDQDQTPSSTQYNDAVQRIMDDMTAVRAHQESTLGVLVSSWNEAEQIISTVQEKGLIDTEFSVFSTKAKANGNVTLGVKTLQSGIELLKNPPILTASVSDKRIGPVYGKAYGLFIEGNESGEDGVRPEDNNGQKIIDQKDTFWEVEAVTLQEKPEDDTFSAQSVIVDEITLTVNIALSFKNQINLNFFSIDPHAFSQSTYFDITSINVISGARTIPVLASPVTVTGRSRITFTTISATGLQVTLKQNKGYFLKYHLGRFVLENNEKWVDFTGPVLIDRVKRRGGDVNKAINEEIVDAGSWIASVWFPDAPTAAEADLNVLEGEAGYLRVDSTESRRKRWAIGIQEIDFGEEIYEDVSEIVSFPYDMPDETTSVYLTVDDETPPGTRISYSLSFDDGASWNPIIPINRPQVQLPSGYMVPQRLLINSDLSNQRKENTLTGISAYINTPNREVRVRAVLEKDEGTSNTPRILAFDPIFDTAVS